MAFEFELRDLSFVPRWSVVRLLKRQNVAEHQYYTAIYALQILDLLGPETRETWTDRVRAQVLSYALVHDLEESYVGDIPGPVKRAIIGHGELGDLIEAENEARYPSLAKYTVEVTAITAAVVKVASLMDEVMLLIQEERMGNRLLLHVGENSRNRLEAAWFALPWDTQYKTKLWLTEIVPAIERAKTQDLRHITG